jgi:RecA-family ATPase
LRLLAAFNAVPDNERDRRWRDRYAGIDEILQYVYGKKAREDAERESGHEAQETLTASPFDASKLATLPRREFVYGHFLIRKFLSVIGAPGGTGKTAYATGVALSVALGEELLGETVHQRGTVWIYNLEDPLDELYRRVWAACQHHNINPARLEGRLFCDSGRSTPLVVAKLDDAGNAYATPLVDELAAEIRSREVILFIPDPIRKSHRTVENSNDHMDFVADLWSQVAEKANCCIMPLHHFRKGGQSGDSDAFRGASALIDASRAALSLAPMSEETRQRRSTSLHGTASATFAQTTLN